VRAFGLGLVAVALALVGIRAAAAAAPADRAHASRSRPAAVEQRPPTRVSLFGDSLAHQAQAAFSAALAEAGPVDLHASTYPTTALCDFRREIPADLVTRRPQVLVLEFSGNSWTDCMRDPATGDFRRDGALLAKYEQDVTAVADTFTRRGTKVLLIGAPRPGDDSNPSIGRVHVRALYQSLAARLDGVEFADAGTAVLDHGNFTATLPCLPFEDGSVGCHDGRIAVRAPDKLHLCPWPGPAVDPLVGRCPIYSSGAYRFAHAMHDAVVREEDTNAS